MNCWEFRKCKPELRDKCKAYPDRGLDCWKVTGTFCRGVEQGTSALKIAFCRACSFYEKYAHKF